jgi:hypothetical protein
MVAFVDWLAHRSVETLLRLLESADYFNPQQYNSAFIEGLNELLGRIQDPVAREQIVAMREFDFGSYISRSLQRSGFRGDDLQENVHDVVVRLLLKPGKLFLGWNPKQHGSLDRRFRAAVWNRIRNISEKERNRRKWTTSTDPTTMSAMYAGREPHSSSLVDQFRRVVGERLGILGVFILDWRLGGRETKELVGMPELGSPSVYRIKREVQQLKQLAHDFAVKHGDPDFLRSIERGIEGEAKTVKKRQQTVLARQAGGSG